MSPDHHPRYVVREITGHGFSPGGYRATTDWWVADTWYCWSVVAYFRARTGGDLRTQPAARKAAAERRCAELNAEHDAWLACA